MTRQHVAVVEIPDHDLPANVAEIPGIWAERVVLRLGPTWTGCSIEVDGHLWPVSTLDVAVRVGHFTQVIVTRDIDGHPETIRIETNDLRTTP